jgi:hypothetical protein
VKRERRHQSLLGPSKKHILKFRRSSNDLWEVKVATAKKGYVRSPGSSSPSTIKGGAKKGAKKGSKKK